MSNEVILKQLIDHSSSTYSYLIFDQNSRQALLIDCVFEQHKRDLSLIHELGLTLLATIETHCHADHVTGAWLMKHTLNSQIMASQKTGIAYLNRNLKSGDVIPFGGHHLQVRDTPGHTAGCISLILDNQSMVFTGDSLLIRGSGRTDFQEGSAGQLYQSIKRQLFNLPDASTVYPGHDYSGRMSSTIGEEKKYNPRIGGSANKEDFVGYMENMCLPHPKQLDIAVPANMQAGRPKEDALPSQPDWAPVITTYSQILKISPEWVAAHRNEVTILDVRTRQELEEENATITGALHIPIKELRNRLNEVPNDKPVMTICRSGKRSALAFTILQQDGRLKVANIDGGLLKWQQEGLPLDCNWK
ncbi:MAG: MBL fold metallo-hydrolase [Pseudomonadales bacterium]|nr:MBL fold metallo-hydrolase [Pseudomonadales bacterium]